MKHTAKSLLIIAIVAFPVSATAGAFGSSAVKDASVSNSGASGDSVWCDRIEANVPERLASDMNCGGAAARPRGLRGFFASLTGPKSGPSDDNDNDDVVRRPLPPTTTVSDDPDTPPTGTPPTGTPPTSEPPSDFVSKADRLADFDTTFDTIDEKSDQFQQEVRDYREQFGGRGNWADFNPSTSE